MHRVAVVGTTGSGKTTFAAALAARLGAPHVELDALFWAPGWTPVPPETFRARVSARVSDPRWVTDGNYSSLVLTLIWPRADTVVWLDYPLHVTLWRLFRRIVVRIGSGEEFWPGTGNRETVRNAFLRRDPLWLFALRTHHGRQRRFAEFFTRPEHAHIAKHRFRDPREAARWLSSVKG